MAEPSAAAGVPPSHQPAAGRTIGALLVLLQLANSMTAVQCTRFGQHDGMTAGFGHNMIKELKLEKLPDMDKVYLRVYLFDVFRARSQNILL